LRHTRIAATCGIALSLFVSHGELIAQEHTGSAELYTTHVRPILQANCYRCHSGMNHRGGLNLETREAMLKGGSDGPALIPGDPARSLLVHLIRHEGPANGPRPMPPRGKLNDAEIGLVERWIKAGALMPEQHH
jgi:mono/diheme cytochrome c family protein